MSIERGVNCAARTIRRNHRSARSSLFRLERPTNGSQGGKELKARAACSRRNEPLYSDVQPVPVLVSATVHPGTPESAMHHPNEPGIACRSVLRIYNPPDAGELLMSWLSGRYLPIDLARSRLDASFGHGGSTSINIQVFLENLFFHPKHYKRPLCLLHLHRDFIIPLLRIFNPFATADNRFNLTTVDTLIWCFRYRYMWKRYGDQYPNAAAWDLHYQEK
ncbi:hypothetical protein ANTPLA_LOCUS7435 [Anthophora plagiata]